MGRHINKEQQQEQEQKKPFKEGDFVFAKVRGFRAWPARILQHEGSMYQVFFYGTSNIAKVGSTQLFEYDKYKVRLGDVRRRANNSFKIAMLQVEKLQDRTKRDRDYLQAKAAMRADSESDSDSNNTSSALPRKNSKFVHITGDTDSE